MKNLSNKKRRILLLEPNYKNKFPPIGLMKISTYHKKLGDYVRFYKGDLKKLVLDEVLREVLSKLYFIEPLIDWNKHHTKLSLFIQRGKANLLKLNKIRESENLPLIKSTLKYYRLYYVKGKYKSDPQWDRVYITTLFTFHWKATINTINFAKFFVKDLNELKVGGILASLMPEDIQAETGIKPIKGLLDKPYQLDKNSAMVVDNQPLDYTILDEIDYQYPFTNTYFTYLTRGCVNKCKFCAVPKLEPSFKCRIPSFRNFRRTEKWFGEQKNLVLMDNNVLASEDFPQLIEDIKKMGFSKGAEYIKPNLLDIAIRNLKSGLNDTGCTKKSFRLINEMQTKLKGSTSQKYYDILVDHNLLDINQTTKENLLKAYPLIKDIYNKNRSFRKGLKFVDFNQGIDCRQITPEKMKLISEIAINPLRIAFDDLKFEKKYRRAVELAAEFGIKEFSNYILYNYKDHPNDLYNRLEINMELCETLGIHIYSFPMKYIPIQGSSAKNREYTGGHWNKKFVGAIQAILNVTKGIVAPPNKNGNKRSFFKKAFGKDLSEFQMLLYMPETYIVYRKLFEKILGFTGEWLKDFESLNEQEKKILLPVIENKQFESKIQFENYKLDGILKHYKIKRDDIRKHNNSEQELKYHLTKNVFGNTAN